MSKYIFSKNISHEAVPLPTSRKLGDWGLSIKASCVDSTKPPEVVFASEIEGLKEQKFRPVERISLEPYERDHIVVSGMYRPDPEDFPQDNIK